METGSDDVLEQAARWRAEGRRVALATVVRTWGSSPRPAGSELAVRDDGAFVGSVSGGCIEGAVVTEALALLAQGGAARRLDFGVTDERAWEVGLACGGRVQVLVAALAGARAAVYEALAEERAARRATVLATRLGTGEAWLMTTGAARDRARAPEERGAAEQAAAARAVAEAIETDRAVTVGDGDEAIFYAPYLPPLRLLIVGAVHVAQPLARMAALAGFAVTVIDPRAAFATPARFPEVALSSAWPDEALAALAPDGRTAVVTLTHDAKLDDPALLAALGSPAFYVGCLGSGRTHAARLDRLRAHGVDEAALARLHGPVGLRIGARTPAEIALSILAQVVERLRARPTVPVAAAVADAAVVAAIAAP